MENRPIVQNFLGKPIRFYKTKFRLEIRGHNATQSEAEMRCCNVTSSTHSFTLETLAIPFPDFCSALGYAEEAVRRIIDNSRDVFDGFYRHEIITDALGRNQKTIILSQEMVDGLVFKLSTSRIKDPLIRSRVIEFQRWVVITIGLIRRGKLKMTHDLATSFSCPPDYQNLLMLPSGRDLKRAVGMVADKEGVSAETVYRKLRRLRGSNVINARGVPRKQRAS